MFSESIIATDVRNPETSQLEHFTTSAHAQASPFFHAYDVKPSESTREATRRAQEVQAKLSQEVGADFFSLLGIMSGSRAGKVADNAKVIFEQSSAREYDYKLREQQQKRRT